MKKVLKISGVALIGTLLVSMIANLGLINSYNQKASVISGEVLGATTDGLIGYWNFDEGSGTSAADSSGNSNNGTLNSVSWVDGKVNKALSFAGCCGKDSVSVPASSSLNNLSSLSVSFWINLRSSTSTRGIILGKSNDPYGPTNGWGIYVLDSKIYFKSRFTSTVLSKTINYTLPFNTWTHITLSWDGSPNSGVVAYINGVSTSLINNSLASGSYVDDSNRPFIIGNYTSLVRPPDAILDEVRLYNRVLSSQEATDIYLDNNDNPSTPPITSDNTAPVISNITGNVTSNSAMISWNTDEASDTQVEYGLTTSYGSSSTLKDNVSGVTNHSVSLSGLSANTTYNYRVKSKDSSGNLSISANATFSTSNTSSPSSDSTAPSTPTNLSGVPSSSSVSLSWSASTDNVGVSGYYIYRNNIRLSSSIGSSFSDSGLSANTSYSYKVSAYDAVGNESVLSDQVTITTLTSQTLPQNTAPGSLNLKGPDGIIRSYSLNSHPRVWFDGLNGSTVNLLKDPDGSGPSVSTSYNNPAALAARTRAQAGRGVLGNEGNGIQPLLLAIGYFMDNNAKFSDGTPYLQEFNNILDRTKEDYRFGGCLYSGTACGTAASDYAGEALMDWALAYTLMHDSLTPEKRSQFSSMMFNGVIDPWCEQRLKRRDGIISKSGVSVTLAGASWDSSIKVGAQIGLKNKDSHGGGINWFRIMAIQNGVLTVDASFPDYTANAWYYTTDPWTPNSCGFAYFAMSHPNVPGYLVKTDSATLSSAVSATVNPPPLGGVVDTITINKSNWMPQAQLPYFIRMTSSYPNVGEVAKVIAVSGNTLTILRGELDTTVSHNQGASIIYYPIDKYEETTADIGLDNRNLTRAQSILGMAIALADEDPRAASVIEKASVYFYDKTYLQAKKYWTLHNSSAVEYGMGRAIPHFSSIVMSFKNSFSPSLDFSGGDYLKNTSGLFNIYWATPWDNTQFLRWGTEAGDNCSSSSVGYLYSIACFIPAVTQQLLYPNDVITTYSNFQHSVKNNWYSSMFGQAKLQADAAWVSGINAVRLLLAGDFNSFPTSDYTLNNSLPTSRLWANGDSSTPGTGLSTFVSKTDWTSNATQLWGLYTDTFSDKMLFNDALSTYSIGKNGWLIDNNYVPSTHAPGIGYQSTVDFGYAYKAGIRVEKGDLPQTVSGIGKDNYAYFSVDALHTNDNNSDYHQVSRELKHFAHFKVGKEYIIAYDDIAKGNAERIRSFIHYANNSESNEGYSALDSSVKYMDSRNLASKILTTFVMPRVTTPKIYDLGVNVPGGNGSIVVGGDCSSSAPCRIKNGSSVFSYTKSYSINGVGPSSGNAYVYVWVSSSGQLYAGVSSNMSSISVPSDVINAGVVTDFPSDAIVRLAKVRFAGVNTASPECPGSLAASRFIAAREWGSCVGNHTRVVFMDAGVSTQAEFIAVHRPTSNLQETPDNIYNLVSISSAFIGVEIDGSDSAVAIFPREGKSNSTLSFSSTFSGSGRYLISGLVGGQYSVVKDGVSLGSFNVGYDGTLYFTSTKGSFQISLVGQPLPPIVITPPVENPTSTSSPSSQLSLNDRIVTTANLNVRSTASPTGTLLGTNPINTAGTLIGGPTSSGGFVWWNVNYDIGVDGWSVQDYLQKTGSDTTPPTISSISIGSIDTDSAIVTWLTNEVSDTQVEYGLTTSYGSSSSIVDSTNRVTNHSITLNNLTPGTTYHYRVKSRDISNNLTTSSDRTFTTQFLSNPNAAFISNVQVTSITSNSATITWNTDKLAASQVLFGIVDTVNTGTAQSNTTSGVLVHSITLNNLVPCSKYRFKAKSFVSTLESSSAIGTFGTLGCKGNATVLDEAGKEIFRTTGGDFNLDSAENKMKISVTQGGIGPSSLVFQVQSLSRVEFANSVLPPNGKIYSRTPIYHIAAYQTPTSTVSNFNKPVVLTFTYGDADIEGLLESSLKLYKYTNSIWQELIDCSLDESTNTITCGSTGFSEIALVGDKSADSTGGVSNLSGNNVSYSDSTTVSSNVNTDNTINNDATTSVVKLNIQPITINLSRGSKNSQVTDLQNFLISQSLLSSDSNTGFFGPLTEESVKAFQKKYNIVSSGSPATTGFGSVGPKTRAKINEIIGGSNTAVNIKPAVTSSLSIGTQLKKNIYRGITGTDVTTLQNVLIKEGFLAPGNNTGYFGPLTESALKLFQQKYNIVKSGTASSTGFGATGPKTRSKVNELGGF